jgi:hypothetical protein
MRRQRTAWKLRQSAALRERSEIKTEEVEALDQSRDLRFRGGVIAGIERDAAAAFGPWIARNELRPEMVEGLHDTGARTLIPSKTRVFIDFIGEAFRHERLERFLLGWKHPSGKKSLRINKLEHILVVQMIPSERQGYAPTERFAGSLG